MPASPEFTAIRYAVADGIATIELNRARAFCAGDDLSAAGFDVVARAAARNTEELAPQVPWIKEPPFERRRR